MLGKTKEDKNQHERLREKAWVTEISTKSQGRHLKRCGHVMRRLENYVGKMAIYKIIKSKEAVADPNDVEGLHQNRLRILDWK